MRPGCQQTGLVKIKKKLENNLDMHGDLGPLSHIRIRHFNFTYVRYRTFLDDCTVMMTNTMPLDKCTIKIVIRCFVKVGPFLENQDKTSYVLIDHTRNSPVVLIYSTTG